MFKAFLKEIDFYLDYHSETVSNLHDEIWLYSCFMDIDKKNGHYERWI